MVFSRRFYSMLIMTTLLALLFGAFPTAPASALSYTVNTTDDFIIGTCDGTHCSLREALLAAQLPGPDVIQFNIPGCPGVCTITPSGNLPFLTDDQTIINGYSQPTSAVATELTPAQLRIEIDGTNVTTNNGFNVVSSNNEIAGLIINRFGLYGIAVYGSTVTNNLVWGNVIGTNLSSSPGLGNGGGVGIGDAAHSNVIGGDAFGDRNVISGNSVNGIDVIALPVAPAYDNTISGNFIGTTTDGELALPNGHSGIQLGYGAHGTIVGGTSSAERNVISGNTIAGVWIWKPLTVDNEVFGNFIGTNVGGNIPVPNGQNGIEILDGANNNVIGGDTSMKRNVISGNGTNGVRLYGVDTIQNQVSGNYIGTWATGSLAMGNGNSGVLITEGASDNIIGGSSSGEGNLISGNNDYGVYITDGLALPEYPSGNSVLGNLIGTDYLGSSPLPNDNDGVRIDGGAKNNTIGGTTALESNVLSGNTYGGVTIAGTGTTGNTVIGNYIGVQNDGATPLPNNSNGVTIWGGAQSNTIGGDTPGERNVISANASQGIALQDTNTRFNVITGNYIGVDSSGNVDLGNTSSGVRITNGAQGNTLGGDTSGEGNVISGNGLDGIEVSGTDTDGNTIAGNLIGTNALGTLDLGNSAEGISIHGGVSGTTVGGDTPEERNVIAGNGSWGIRLEDSDTDGNTISGNHIGVNSVGDAALPNDTGGVWIRLGASNNTIGGSITGERNVIAGHNGTEVAISGVGTTGNVVSGNYIGVGADGLTDLSPMGTGVNLESGVQNTTIGGDTPGERNVISGNGDGVSLNGIGNSNNDVVGNYIGTDHTGTIDVGNDSFGIQIWNGAASNNIGGDSPGEGNLISGNGGAGIKIESATTTGNVVFGNIIGLDETGLHTLGNDTDGIHISSGSSNNTIGGVGTGQRNVISGNGQKGIGLSGVGTTGNVISGNYIGVNIRGWGNLGNTSHGILVGSDSPGNTIGPANLIANNGSDGVYIFGASSFGNVVTQNSIYNNFSSGINLISGANNGISPPVITSTSMSSVTIEGTACVDCIVEAFSNPDSDGEGKTYVGTVTATGGTWSLSVPCISGEYLTATATDATDGTSEFSSVFTSTVKCLFLPLIMR